MISLMETACFRGFFGRHLPGFYLKLLELLSFIMTIMTDDFYFLEKTFSVSSLLDPIVALLLIQIWAVRWAIGCVNPAS